MREIKENPKKRFCCFELAVLQSEKKKRKALNKFSFATPTTYFDIFVSNFRFFFFSCTIFSRLYSFVWLNLYKKHDTYFPLKLVLNLTSQRALTTMFISFDGGKQNIFTTTFNTIHLLESLLVKCVYTDENRLIHFFLFPFVIRYNVVNYFPFVIHSFQWRFVFWLLFLFSQRLLT